ncbi:hypothetical protein JXL19_01010 [bacterium]|nr:hypothetical protein [bacterium]
MKITKKMLTKNHSLAPHITAIFIILSLILCQGLAGCKKSGGTSGATTGTGTDTEVTDGETATGSAVISLTGSPTTLYVGQPTYAIITANVKDDQGAPLNGVIVNFTTDLGGITPSVMTNTSGVATAAFTPGINVGVATITATAKGASESIAITIMPGAHSNIVLATDLAMNPDPDRIYIKGTDKNQTSTLTFEIRDKNGNPVGDGVRVEFILLNNGLGGGESLKPGAGVDDSINVFGALTVGGKVSTTLESGYKAGTVQIVAFIDDYINNGYPDDEEVQSASISIAIAGGLPDGENFSAHPKTLNIAGLVYSNLEDTIYAKMTDRYHNPVPPGTAVYFTANYASITSPGIVPDSTGASEAEAMLTSMGKMPEDGFVTVAASTQTGNWGRILCLTRDPSNPSIIYAGTDGAGIIKTTDAKSDPVHWSWIGRPETGLKNGVVRDIKVDENQTSIVYAATDGGIFRSIGGGGRWENMSISKEIKGEAPPENGGNLNVADADSDGLSDQTYTLDYPSDQNRAKTRVYLSGVETRQYIYTDAKHIAFIVKGTNLINGAAVTVDYQTSDTLPIIYSVYALAIDSDPVDPVNKSKIYAALYGSGIYKSEDSGYTWQRKNSGILNTNVMSLAIDPTASTRLYAGTCGGGVFRTEDGGETWTPRNNGLSSTVINTILVNPVRTREVYAGTMLGGIYRSTNWANDWVQATTNVNSSDVNNTYVKDVVIDAIDGTLYAGTYTDGNSPVGGVFRSDDSGATWSRVTSLGNNAIFALEIDGASGNDMLFAGTYKRFIFKSADSGTTWNRVNITTPDDLYNIFTTTQVLYSGNTQITVTPEYATYQKYGTFSSLFNTEAQTFIYTVSDINGNPLTFGTTISVTASEGALAGNTNVDMPDVQYGNTVYHLTWTNDLTDKSNKWSTLTITVTSENNGDIECSLLRNLIGVLEISPGTKNIVAGGGNATFTASGGSDVPANYIWTTNEGTFLASGTSIQLGGRTAVLITTAAADGMTFTVSVKDDKTGQTDEATVTQAK